ncbi:MAG: hypothetical protein HC904_07560 [Blastochloris sp.]|nr:hypothetical protein [Blastochloris sp.]
MKKLRRHAAGRIKGKGALKSGLVVLPAWLGGSDHFPQPIVFRTSWGSDRPRQGQMILGVCRGF